MRHWSLTIRRWFSMRHSNCAFLISRLLSDMLSCHFMLGPTCLVVILCLFHFLIPDTLEWLTVVTSCTFAGSIQCDTKISDLRPQTPENLRPLDFFWKRFDWSKKLIIHNINNIYLYHTKKIKDRTVATIQRENTLGYLSADIISWVANILPRAKLEENCELRGTDDVQEQISELIIHQIFPLVCDWPKRVTIFPSFQNWARCEKDLKDNKDNGLHLGRKYARILVLGHYLFLVYVAHSFPRASLLENCSLFGTDNVRGQIPEYIFAPNGGYCLYIFAPNGGYCLYYPSNIFGKMGSFENWVIFNNYSTSARWIWDDR